MYTSICVAVWHSQPYKIAWAQPGPAPLAVLTMEPISLVHA